MLDSGASVSFATRALVERLGLRLTPVSRSLQVEVADGGTTAVLGEVLMPVRCQTYKGRVQMLVLDSLVPGVDLILGDSWMKLHKCTLNYDRGQALLWRDGKLHALRMEPEAPQPSAPQARSAAVATLAAAVGMPLLLTRHQAQRVMRKQQRSFLVVVKAVSAQETAMRKRTAAGTLMCAPKCCTAATAPPVEGLVPDKDLQALLAEYPDVTGPLTAPSKLTAPVEVCRLRALLQRGGRSMCKSQTHP